MSNDPLVGLLWPEKPEPGAYKALRDTLYDLRRAIGDASAEPPFLLIGGDTIQFNLASSYKLDVSDFERQVAHFDRTPGASAGLRIEALESIIGLYSGTFLSDMPAVDSESFEEWVLSKRERLHLKAVRILQQLATIYVQQGKYELAQAPVRRRLELEPWQEEAHRQLMWLLTFSGKRCMALAQYRACCRALARELSAEPSDETKVLHRQIKEGGRLPTRW